MIMHVLIEDNKTKSRKAINGAVYIGLSTLANGTTSMTLIMKEGSHVEVNVKDKCTIYVNQSNEPTSEKSK